MSGFQSVKLWLVGMLGLPRDALHIYVGLTVFLGFAALFRLPLRDWRPIAAALLAAIAGEAWDLFDARGGMAVRTGARNKPWAGDRTGPDYIAFGNLLAGRATIDGIGDACEAVLGAIFADAGYDAAKEVVRRFWEPQLSVLELGGPTPKSVLQEWAQGRRLSLPRYVEISREGPDHMPRFTAEVQIGGVAPERGEGANKRAAEQAAALAMLLREGVWQAPAHD